MFFFYFNSFLLLQISSCLSRTHFNYTLQSKKNKQSIDPKTKNSRSAPCLCDLLVFGMVKKTRRQGGLTFFFSAHSQLASYFARIISYFFGCCWCFWFFFCVRFDEATNSPTIQISNYRFVRDSHSSITT